MAERKEEVEGSIHESLVSLGSQELGNLTHILASEASLQLERLRAMFESPREAEKLIGFLDNLCIEQKRLLIGRVTLRLLRRITVFLEDLDGNGEMMESGLNSNGFDVGNRQKGGIDRNKDVSCHRKPANSFCDGRRNIKKNFDVNTTKFFYECNDPVSDLSNSRRYWRDADASLLLLLLSELQDHECLEAVKKWQIDPLLYKHFIERDFSANNSGKSPRKKWCSRSRLCSEIIRKYLCENIMKMGYNAPGLMVGVNVQTASLSSYIDIISRYQRLLKNLCNSENYYFKENPCPPTSIATILSLPSDVCNGSKSEQRQRVCSICGEDFEVGTIASCLPCSHVYHWDCIHPWLKTRNTCPVCRHELPTDDVFYELCRHWRFLMQRAQ